MIHILTAMLPIASAGGGPANVLILANAADTSAIAVAEHYAEERSLLPGHICPISGVDSTSNTIPLTDYELYISDGLQSCLDTLPQPEEIDILVLVRGLPYRVELPTGFTTSLEAMLQISDTTHSSDGEALAGRPLVNSGGTYSASIQNPAYVGASSTGEFELSNTYMAHYSTALTIASDDRQPRSFSRSEASVMWGWQFTDSLFLVSRLDGFDHDDAMDLIDRGVAADGSFPEGAITCMAAADSARGARDPECHHTIGLLDGAGIEAAWIDTHDPELSGAVLAGLMTGTTSLQGGIEDNTWLPGAFAGNLTSYGAVPQNFRCSADGECPDAESQTSIARFVRGGATFAHGTANEPLNNSFPGSGLFLLATMGYGVIESAFFTQRYLYWQNIYLGDPLSSPWAERPTVSISESVAENRPVEFTATHPAGIAELRLYADGIRVDETLPLSASITAREGAEISLLAVAVAVNATVDRPGWPQPTQQPRPDIQGWSSRTITVGEAITEMDTGVWADTGSAPDFRPPELPNSTDKSGGCSAISRSASDWIWVFGLLAIAIRPSQRRT